MSYARHLNDQLDSLKKWKKEATQVMDRWDAVDKEVRSHPSSKPGLFVSEEALRLIRERDLVYSLLPEIKEALREAFERSKPENQNGASLFHVHYKSRRALEKLSSIELH